MKSVSVASYQMSMRSPQTRRTLRSQAASGPVKTTSTSVTLEDKPKVQDDIAEVPMTTYKRQRPSTTMGGPASNAALLSSPGFSQTPDTKHRFNLSTPGFGAGMSPIPPAILPPTPANTNDVTLDSVMSPIKTPGIITSAPAFSGPADVVDRHITLFGVPESLRDRAIAQVGCGTKVLHIESSEGNYIVLSLPSLSAVKLALAHHGSMLRDDTAVGDRSGMGTYILGVRRTRRSDLSRSYLATLPIPSTIASATPIATPLKTPARGNRGDNARDSTNSNAVVDKDAPVSDAHVATLLRSPFDISRKRKLISPSTVAAEEPVRNRKSFCNTVFGW